MGSRALSTDFIIPDAQSIRTRRWQRALRDEAESSTGKSVKRANADSRIHAQIDPYAAGRCAPDYPDVARLILDVRAIPRIMKECATTVVGNAAAIDATLDGVVVRVAIGLG